MNHQATVTGTSDKPFFRAGLQFEKKTRVVIVDSEGKAALEREISAKRNSRLILADPGFVDTASPLTAPDVKGVHLSAAAVKLYRAPPSGEIHERVRAAEQRAEAADLRAMEMEDLNQKLASSLAGLSDRLTAIEKKKQAA